MFATSHFSYDIYNLPNGMKFLIKTHAIVLIYVRKFTIFTPTFDTGARIKPTILNFNLMEYYGPLSCDCS